MTPLLTADLDRIEKAMQALQAASPNPAYDAALQLVKEIRDARSSVVFCRGMLARIREAVAANDPKRVDALAQAAYEWCPLSEEERAALVAGLTIL